jgi:RHS repeat-associated protein
VRATTHTTNSLTAFSGHRFHFNGQEADNEVYGEGNVYDYGFRIYNPRLGKFLTVDPLTSTFPFLTPYQYASNKPIVAIDLDGLECLWVHIYKDKDGTVLRTTTTQDVSEEQRAEASNTLGFELPTNGVVVTSEQEGQKKLDYYVPEVEIHAKRTEPSKTDKIIEAIKNFDQKLQGSNDGTNSGGEYSGVKGMYKGADLLDNVGDKLSYVPLPPFKILGNAFSLEADALRTIADFNNKDVAKGAAIWNVGVRGITFGLGEKVSNDIKKANFSEVKTYIYDQTSRKLLDKIKDETTVKPKTEE